MTNGVPLQPTNGCSWLWVRHRLILHTHTHTHTHAHPPSITPLYAQIILTPNCNSTPTHSPTAPHRTHTNSSPHIQPCTTLTGTYLHHYPIHTHLHTPDHPLSTSNFPHPHQHHYTSFWIDAAVSMFEPGGGGAGFAGSLRQLGGVEHHGHSWCWLTAWGVWRWLEISPSQLLGLKQRSQCDGWCWSQWGWQVRKISLQEAETCQQSRSEFLPAACMSGV